MAAGMGIAALEIELLTVFIIAAAVGIFVAKVGRFPYTIALLIAGIGVSILGIRFNIQLSHDIIFLVLLPPLLFEGAATMDLDRLRRNLLPITMMAIPGLTISILVLGYLGTYAFGFPLAISLLFAAIILPTDPVSVLALFKDIGAPKRLSVLLEGESLFNDGVGVVIFSSILAIVMELQETRTTLTALVDAARLTEIVTGIIVNSAGGAVVGAVTGYAVYRIMIGLDEHMTEIVLTAILAFGSFLLAEHYLHVSGVIATVVAGLLIGNRGAEDAMSPQTKISVFDTWETAAFIVNTLIFLLIGATTPVQDFIAYHRLIIAAILLVLLVRVLVVYPMTFIANRFSNLAVPLDYQHILVWGGLHASIPIALVLGLPATVPHREQIRAMVFGVAAFSLIVQGLTMAKVLDRLDIVRKTETKNLYELLIGRARAVDEALDAIERLHRARKIPSLVYETFKDRYRAEKDELNQYISRVLAENPGLQEEEITLGERRALNQEKSAVKDAMRSGIISEDVGERLLEEINLQIDRAESGENTVDYHREEEPEWFWQDLVEEHGLTDENSDQ
ncbi:MAG: cation:proton antiporter [Candidatus Nanohaloarchaea archaeon]|nr:cation:proton antiporter [Candidatus Nanohaloarchaea archaeon]